MIKRVFFLTVVVISAFAVSLIYPPAFADSPQELAFSNSFTPANGFYKNPWNSSVPVSSLPPVINDKKATNEVWREMRGTWIATVKNINMPSGMNEESFTKWASETMETLKENKLNTAVFQIRPTSDALYKSSIVPWSSFITGKTQGTDPGYDPLEIVLEEAHKRGIELHAWINPYRVSMPGDKIQSISSSNIAAKNPSWLVNYGGHYYLNPGVPQVREHLVEVVSEIVENYDIDAIHIDDYFYPYPISGEKYNDDNEYALYGSEYANKEDWRRDNVTNLVRDLYSAIKSRKSYVQLGISPFGVWRNKANDPTGSDTNAGHECYDSLYADTRLWINEGIIDYITPQIYWSRELNQAPYQILVEWWNKEIETQAHNKPINLYIGQANYKVADNFDTKWLDPNEISEQTAINRQSENVLGQMHYSFSSVKENKLNHIGLLKENHYKHIALTPSQAINEPQDSQPVTNISGARHDSKINLVISTNDTNCRKFLVYRFEGNSVEELNENSLFDIIYKTDADTIYEDTKIILGKTYTYAIKSVSVHGVINQTFKSITVN